MHEHDTDPITERLHAESERLRRRVLLLTLVPVAVAILLIAVTSRQVANARGELSVLVDSAAQLRQEVATRLEALQAARQEKDSLEAQVTALKGWVQQRNARVADSIQRAATLQFETASVKPRVYIHIVEENQRAGARRIQRQLEAGGFVVPGIQRVSQGPRTSVVRYFKENERAGADRVRDIVAAAGVSLTVSDLSRRFGSSGAIRASHYEIWFGPDFRGS